MSADIKLYLTSGLHIRIRFGRILLYRPSNIHIAKD